MCVKKSMFIKFKDLANGNVSCGNDSNVSVKGKCNILIILEDGRHEFISNAYYILNMKNNILIFRQLSQKGYDIHMIDLSLYVKD